MRILGIDPGLRRTGFGVIDAQGSHLQYVTSGTIVVPADEPLAQRLKVILDNVREIVRETSPTVSALEKVFVNTNPTSTLLLGQARGAAMCALADHGLLVHEYTALQIKKSVVGNGHAAKEQVQAMVQHLLQLNGLPAADSADALACAICHAHIGPMADRLTQAAGLPSRRGLRLRAGRLTG
ncbi:crossover junction endodeoxyribonuclease RuvC [Pusillimonas noertemannii]|uniref:Crossover junction endodeoxyribonuclease RuvC n=1 Tax=Pusillimonas noertemannii TaxID=305977 RepID=A0A2U1CRF2_9BURK|nr:crossover junction endodeoxyribonuclease RuvC [Pusillimonas noertemannii]NYT67811.1 crossover junction endodeoxyribonuclease RuvC [Pusillimonas noertemannii]PVY68482.1 Holliday junction endonuclease RuvC [Pusillimonas noertemannii]TFL12040.1 crossover junction endodeoxyribonuclease RuvC [Pusillimonas noertemannii]